jgi:hypothetical protein
VISVRLPVALRLVAAAIDVAIMVLGVWLAEGTSTPWHGYDLAGSASRSRTSVNEAFGL